MELLVVTAILFAIIAAGAPVVGSLYREMRLASATGRIYSGFLQLRLILSDQMRGTVMSLSHPKQMIRFEGVAMVARWDESKQDYEMFYNLHVPDATDTAGHPLSAITPKPGIGYARFNELEPVSLGHGMRAVGLRRKDGTTSGYELELVPSTSFAVLMDENGVAIPQAQMIYVNLQEPPPGPPTPGPWDAWNTEPYNPATYDPNAPNGTPGQGEGFLSSLPMIIVYNDDDLPHDENGARVYRQADGTLNFNLDPNELLRVTRGRMAMMTLQGSSALEF